MLVRTHISLSEFLNAGCCLLLLLAFGCSNSRTPIEPSEGKLKVAQGAMLVDVRSESEFEAGHIDGARNIPHDEIERRLGELGNDTDREIVLYCGSGRRAGLAQETLFAHGFKRVFNGGAYQSWLHGDPQSTPQR